MNWQQFLDGNYLADYLLVCNDYIMKSYLMYDSFVVKMVFVENDRKAMISLDWLNFALG